MKSNIEFKLVCGGCGSLAIKIENPVSASRKAVVHCGECGASRGTLGALRDLAMLPDVHTAIRQVTSKVKYQSELVVMHQELQGLRRKVLLAEANRTD
jgi:predicted amidophosphoribosyltransferase